MPGIGTRFWVLLMERTRLYSGDPPNVGSYNNLIDYNPDTIARKVNILGCQYQIDATNNTNRQINWVGLFIRNYNELTGDLSFALYGNNNGTSSITIIYENPGQINDDYHFPLILRAFNWRDFAFYRFVLYNYYNSSEIIEAGLFMLGRYYDLASRWEWNSEDSPSFFMEATRAFDGRVFVTAGNNQSCRNIIRQYQYLSDSEITVLRNVWNDTRGGEFPMVITDDIPTTGWSPTSSIANSKTSRLVRFNHPPDQDGRIKLGEVEIQSGLWNVTLYMEELPWEGTGYLE